MYLGSPFLNNLFLLHLVLVSMYLVSCVMKGPTSQRHRNVSISAFPILVYVFTNLIWPEFQECEDVSQLEFGEKRQKFKKYNQLDVKVS